MLDKNNSIKNRLYFALTLATFTVMSAIYIANTVFMNIFVNNIYKEAIYNCLDDLKSTAYNVDFIRLKDATALKSNICSEARYEFVWQIRNDQPEAAAVIFGNGQLPAVAPVTTNFDIAHTTYRGVRLWMVSDVFLSPDGAQRTISVALKESAVDAAKNELAMLRAFATFLGAVLMLPLCLFGVYWAQRPLGRLAREIYALDAGKRTHLSNSYPADLTPVVGKINQLIDAYDTLVEANRTRADMLAHNIRNSLSMLGYKMERLEQRKGLEDTLKEYRQRSREILQYVDRQISDSSLPRNEMASPVFVDPELVATRIVAALQRLYAERGIEWQLGTGSACRVRCTESVLGEILFNILDNAGKWARSQVSCQWGPMQQTCADDVGLEMIEIEICDDGPGFSATRASDKLTASDTDVASQASSKGLGVGFELARKLARLYGGNIIVDRGANGGAHIRVQLPGTTAVTGPDSNPAKYPDPVR